MTNAVRSSLVNSSLFERVFGSDQLHSFMGKIVFSCVFRSLLKEIMVRSITKMDLDIH
jgi:hypothetical protein